jgi:hypothetical protein
MVTVFYSRDACISGLACSKVVKQVSLMRAIRAPIPFNDFRTERNTDQICVLILENRRVTIEMANKLQISYSSSQKLSMTDSKVCARWVQTQLME